MGRAIGILFAAFWMLPFRIAKSNPEKYPTIAKLFAVLTSIAALLALSYIVGYYFGSSAQQQIELALNAASPHDKRFMPLTAMSAEECRFWLFLLGGAAGAYLIGLFVVDGILRKRTDRTAGPGMGDDGPMTAEEKEMVRQRTESSTADKVKSVLTRD